MAEAGSKRGDVVSVGFADGDDEPNRVPTVDERVEIRLQGSPYRYIVRVTTDGTTGPKLTELTLEADPGCTIDYEALRSFSTRRLAHSARQWIERRRYPFDNPDDYVDPRHAGKPDPRPEDVDPRLSQLHWRIEMAIMNGDPIRKTIAKQYDVSTRTLDRMIAKARAIGLLDGVEIPRRPSPKYREALKVRHDDEIWLSTHGPDVPRPRKENQ